MTQWTTHTPAFDGDAPEGVTLETHEVERQLASIDHSIVGWTPYTKGEPTWQQSILHRYIPRATYEQVVAWCKANNRDVPAPPIDYEAWAAVSEEYGWGPSEPLRKIDRDHIDNLIAAFKIAMTIPACMEVIEG